MASDDRRVTQFPRGNRLNDTQITSDQRITLFPRGDVKVPVQLACKPEQDDTQESEHSRYTPEAVPTQWLKIPVKRLSDEPESAPKRPTTAFCKQESPWSHFKICMEGEPGRACLAYNLSSPGIVVVIKQHKNAGIDKTRHLVETRGANLVNLVTAFVDGMTVYVAYERMDITLEQLYCSVDLEERDIGFICREILRGLWYIHQSLRVCHTRIRSNKILLNTKGLVKIGDIGASLLEQHQGSEQIDIKSIGWIMAEIMEPGNAHENRRSINLERGEIWSNDIKHFQIQTQTLSVPELLQHVFLASVPDSDSGLLVVPVLKAKGTAVHEYE
ncbi:kinase-like domain-containing protein [Aspergillus recurvatus]